MAKNQISFQIDGTPSELRLKLQNAMPSLTYDGKESRLHELILSSNLRLRDALQAYGYYHATWHTKPLPPNKNGDAVVQYDITLGAATRVRHRDVRILGPITEDPQLRRRIKPFPLVDGNILNQVDYETWKDQSLSFLESKGYVKAQYQRHEILIDKKQNWAEIYLWLNSGERVRVGTINIVGADRYPRWFIERYFTFKPGDWYSPRALSQTQSNLHDANRFQNIQVLGDTAHLNDDSVPVQVKLDSLPEQHLKVGVGYSTNIGLNGILYYDDYNMFRRAQHLHVAVQAAQNTRNIGATYTWPVGSTLGSEYIASTSFQNETYQVWSANELHAAIGRRWALADNARKNVNATIQTTFNLEQANYTVSGISDSSFYLYPSITYSVQNYRNILRPVSGFYVRATAEGASKVWGSTSNYVRLRVRGGWDQMINRNWGVGGRVSLGALWLHGNIRFLPPDLRFFAGGQNSLPGYAFESQGPRDAQGGVIGGTLLAVSGVHINRFITRDWAIDAFYDIGNAFDSFSTFHVLQDVGIGARWYSPVGPIILDLAHPLIAPRAPAVRVALSVGFNF
ncbi:autotransporter assembly complex family protein [Acidithiobacillus sp. IBUN Pt1247-S3]|uniref:autotransporter assembly complex protein TamA n=1 Tax=Acidithiobacillus sp. IBUN Pt1247-S3 TaxID=3166642 RepID=UPI0034E3C049